MFILGGFLAVASLLSTTLAEAPIWYKGGKCGVSKYQDAGEMPLPPGKIVGGKEARPNEFPWQVLAKISVSDTKYALCGGSIISERWVVTGAHCVLPDTTPSNISLVFGEHDKSQPSTVKQTMDVTLIIRHENYNSATHADDITLFKTSKDISLNENVTPICAPDPAKDYTYQKCLVSGWGDLIPQPYPAAGPGENNYPNTLMYVTLNVSTNEYCNSIFFKIPGRPISEDQMCTTDNTGGHQRDPCQVDSGGPLAVKDGNGIFSLIGVVSGGFGCAVGNPGIYTKVINYITWINDKIA